MDELRQAQASVTRALARSRAGEDRVLAAQVRERGEQFSNLLLGLLRMGRVHAADNRAFDQPTKDVKASLDALLALLGTVHLVTVEDQVYLNDVRIKQAASRAGKNLGAELAPHNVGGLTFHAELPEAHVRLLVGLLGSKPSGEHPRTTLSEALTRAGVTAVELAGVFRFRLAGEEAPAPGTAAAPPSQGLVLRLRTAVEEAWDALAVGRIPNVLGLRRLVVEWLAADPASEDSWAQLAQPSSAHAGHASRVAQLVLLCARDAGLPVSVVQDAGVAALLHDVGYAAPVGTTVAFAQHPMLGARALLKQPGFHEAKVRRMLAALHHHDDHASPVRPPLVARLVRVAEDYDVATMRGPTPSTPPEALAMLGGGAGTKFDPVVVQLLINRLGAWPPGTFLGLEDGRVVQSVGSARSFETWATPRAVVVRGAQGQAPTVREVIDLSQGPRVMGALKPRAR